MNRIKKLFKEKSENILTIYFTAGYPLLNDTMAILQELDIADVDLIEIGIPFSDPMADGVTIQDSNAKALENGISLGILFQQLKSLRTITQKPIVLMGYFNPVYKYGIDKFCADAKSVGIDGMIIPDLPIKEYEKKYKNIFEAHALSLCFLITPHTSDERIKEIDKLTSGFIYLVTTTGVTGKNIEFSDQQTSFLKRVTNLGLKNPLLAGFGISNKQGFDAVCKHANGGIIGSSFIKHITHGAAEISKSIQEFIKSIRQ